MTLSYLFKRNNLSTFNERRCCYATTQVHSTDGDRKSKGFSLFSQQPLSALVKIKSLKSHNRMSFLVRRDSMTQSHCRAMNQLFMLAFCCARHWVQFFNFILVLSGRGGGKSVLFRESYSCSRVYQPGFCWGIQRQQRVSAWACDAVIIIPIWRHKTRNGLHNYFFFPPPTTFCVVWNDDDRTFLSWGRATLWDGTDARRLPRFKVRRSFFSTTLPLESTRCAPVPT